MAGRLATECPTDRRHFLVRSNDWFVPKAEENLGSFNGGLLENSRPCSFGPRSQRAQNEHIYTGVLPVNFE